MDALFVPLASIVGASVDQVKLITCLVVAYPLGSVFVRLPSGSGTQDAVARHLFNIGVTFFLTVAVLNLWTGFLQLLGSTVAVYYITKFVKGPSMPWIVFAVAMGHLTVNHIIRSVFQWSYETIEVTSPQMVLTMKLTTFAWNVYDGRRPSTELDKWQLEKRVTTHPSLLAFLGYAFYFPGFLVGPYLDFASYAALVDESLFFKKAESSDNAKSASSSSALKRRIPSGRKRVAYKKLLVGLAFLGLYVTQIGKFNFEVVLQGWFIRKSLWYRILFFQLCGIFERSKYYAIWTLTEGASILTGCGFTGYSPSGASLWQGAANVDIPNIELAPNFKIVLDSWNMKTNVWLRECVYKRVTPKGQKPGFKSSMITFLTSAFWHGIAGGYYLAFILGGFVQTVGRLCRSNIRPLLLPPTPPSTSSSKPSSAPLPAPTLVKRIYDIAGIACAVAMTNYTAAPFMLLSVGKSLYGWHILGWYGHILIFGAMAFFYGGGSTFLKGIQKRRVKRVFGDAVGDVKVNGTNSHMAVTPGAGVVPPLDFAFKNAEKL